MSSSAPSYLQSVRDQYEDFPYPPRDPEQELTLNIQPVIDHLDVMNFYCFGGRQNFQNKFRVLVAGGGTGDTTIYFANTLRSTNAEIVHVDISTNSMEIAKKRAAKRGLQNITWVHRSLLDLPQMKELGEFDYINCGGVLHHLADPDAGLNALRSVLKDDGAIGIMVYGKYGRTGVYAMQETMRLLTKNVPSKSKQVELCNKLLGMLPPGHWWHFQKKHFEGGIRAMGDAEIFDLFLHSQDRAYTVPEIYNWVKRCDLEFLNFIYYNGMARLVYNPLMFLANAELQQLASALPLPDQQALAEVLYGEIFNHFFYVSKHKKQLPQVSDETAIPYFTNLMGFGDSKQAIQQQLAANPSPSVPIVNSSQSGQVKLQRRGFVIELFDLIDGKRSVKEIYAVLCARHPKANLQELRTDMEYLYNTLHHLDWLLLKY